MIFYEQETTLADLLQLNLHCFEEEVRGIVDKAVKEMGMERVLSELNSTWTGTITPQRHTEVHTLLLVNCPYHNVHLFDNKSTITVTTVTKMLSQNGPHSSFSLLTM